MKQSIRILWKIVWYALLVILIAALLFPVYYRDKIAEKIKTTINEHTNTRVDYGKVKLNLFSSFPDLQCSIEDISIKGLALGRDTADLFYAQRLSFDIKLPDLIRNRELIEINRFELNRPKLHIRRLADQSNYDISVKPLNDRPTKSNGFYLRLKDYKIIDGEVHYKELDTGHRISSTGINHSGTLSMADKLIRWQNKTVSNALTVANSKVNLIKHAKLDWAMNLRVDRQSGHIELAENTLRINGLETKIDGSIDKNGHDYLLKLQARSTDTDFKQLLSLLPNIYTDSYTQMKANGSFGLTVDVQGIYNGRAQKYPAYKIDIQVRDGSFSYPDKKASFDQVAFRAHMTNEDRQLAPAMIDIPLFGFRLNGRKMEGSISVEDLQGRSKYKLSLRGVLDLADLAEAYPIQGIDTMRGLVDTDLSLSGSLSSESQTDYGGGFKADQLYIGLSDQMPLELDKLLAQLEKEQVIIEQVKGKIGNTDFAGMATVRDFDAVLGGDKSLSVQLDLTGKLFDANEWMGEDRDSVRLVGADWRKNMLLDVKAKYDKLNFGDYDIRAVAFEGKGDLNSLLVPHTKALVQNSPVQIRGRIDSIYAYSFAGGELHADLRVSSNAFRLDDWMVQGDTTVGFNYAAVPDQMDMDIALEADTLYYADLLIYGVQGLMRLEEQRIFLERFSGKSLDGTIRIDGMYHYTDEMAKPLFDLKYELSKLSIDKAFNTVKTVRALAPIARYVEGVFNTQMLLKGSLGKNYVPEFGSLTGSGLVETLHGVVKRLKPVEQLNDRLKLKLPKNIKLDYTRNWFEIDSGYVQIQAFEKRIDDIRFVVSGRHQILGSMDYKIRMDVPADKIDRAQLPQLLKDQWQALQDKLQKLGVGNMAIDTVMFGIQLRGTLSAPLINFSILNLKTKSINTVLKDVVDDKKTQLRDSLDNKVKEVKEQIKDTVNQVVKEIKDTVETVVDAVKDSVYTVIDDKKEKLKDTVKTKIDDMLGGVVDSTLLDTLGGLLDDWFDKSPLDIFGKKRKDKKEEIKKRLDDWRPLNKRDDN